MEEAYYTDLSRLLLLWDWALPYACFAVEKLIIVQQSE